MSPAERPLCLLREVRIPLIPALVLLVLGLVTGGCSGIPRLRSTEFSIVVEGDSGWQVTKRLAETTAMDQCTDQFVRLLFSNVAFSDGDAHVLLEDLSPGVHVRPLEKAALNYAVRSISWKPPIRSRTKTRVFLSEYEVERYLYRTWISVRYTMKDFRSVLARLYDTQATPLPEEVEQQLLQLFQHRNDSRDGNANSARQSP